MLTVSVAGGWRRGERADQASQTAAWNTLTEYDTSRAMAWRIAQQQDREVAAAWRQVDQRDMSSIEPWRNAEPSDLMPADVRWTQVPQRDLDMRLGWDRTVKPCDVLLRVIYNPRPAHKDVEAAGRHRRVNEFGPRHDAEQTLRDSLYVPGNGPLSFNLGGQRYIPSTAPEVFFDFRYVPPVAPAIQPGDMAAVHVRWGAARGLNQQSLGPWGRARRADGVLTEMPYFDYQGPTKPLPTPPPDPTILDTYMIANTVNLVVLPSRTPVEARNVRLSLDADSYSWSFNAEIFTQAALDMVRPGADGAKSVELDINGWKWVLLVERYSRQRRFPGETYSISGSTRTQLLAAPYAPPRTNLNSAPLNAAQAAEAELRDTGFTLTWSATDWTFPAGAYSYQGQTAMQVIARLAETVGAVVRPARDSDALDVLPRYPVEPWNWDDSTTPINRIIPPAMMTDLNGEWTPQPAWNACYVSGTGQGVSMLVRRGGSAGDNPAPDVLDDWITGQEANRARGVHELSKGGNIEIVGFTLPLFPASDDHGVGLVLPAQLCRVPEEAGTWVGLCLSVEITAEGTGAARVWQNLKLERHH